jgi:hypothetical protein
MASSRSKTPRIRVPSASRQIRFHQLLEAARKSWLHDALKSALSKVDSLILKEELARYVPADSQRILQVAGIRDELVFPVPVLLVASPALVGYYRLLLGVPRKGFYRTETGLGLFTNMEKRGTLTQNQRDALPIFCGAMARELAKLITEISPQITARDVAELPLLTLGAMFQGANNVRIGEEAKQSVFLAVREIVKSHITEQTANRLTLLNAARRRVLISFGADPDICIQEQSPNALRNKVAIEIKGGTDGSNAHNRAGEAEKSHRKAHRQDYRDFWTLIATKGVDIEKLKHESPTTRSWFDVAQVLAQRGVDWTEFRSRLSGELGIQLD